MPQLAEPSADTNNPGSFTTSGGGSVNLFQEIDEGSAAPNDADFVQSPADPVNAVYVTKLQSLTDPVSSTGHILRWRRGKTPATGGNQIDCLVELRQAYVSEASLGTLITSKTVANIPAAFTDDSITLSGAEADSITDYTNLYVRIRFNKV